MNCLLPKVKPYTDPDNTKAGVSHAVMGVVEWSTTVSTGFIRYYLDSSWRTLSGTEAELRSFSDK